MAGAVNSYLMFGNTFRMEEKLRRVITESGYTTRFEEEQRESLPTDIECNVNWAYGMGEFTSFGSVTAILLGCLLIAGCTVLWVTKDDRDDQETN